MKSALRALPFLALLLTPAAAQAEERISHFWNDVRIQPDASLEVTETIDIRAENERINHGIYRDFPTRYRGRNGSRVNVGFTFKGATLDGKPVPASTGAHANGIRIKIGDPDKIVPVGEHRYVLHYRTTRQVGHFKDYDEIYWNATGSGWIFPIDIAEARIRLPQPAAYGQRAVYSGPQGSTSGNARVVEEKPGDITFQTTQPLQANEGLTVAVAFPKGIVADAAQANPSAWWLTDYGPPFVGLAALIGIIGFYFYAWLRAGRNPRAGTIVPIFSPPDELSPAGMRYITKMGADNRAFAAALVDMGVRGHIKLSEEEGGWFSSDKTRLDRLSSETALPPEEEAALRELAGTGEAIMMEQKNHEKFSSALSSLRDVLKEKYEGKLFLRNWGWAGAGVLLFAAAVWLPAAAVVAVTDTGRIWQVGFAVGSLALAAVLLVLAPGFQMAMKWLLILCSFIAAAVAFAFGLPIMGEALESGWLFPMFLPALALPVVVSAFWWIAAPTRQGRAVLDRIAGFKQYLSVTERERFDRMHPPEDTPEIFERYLPYAIALGVENRWADRFAGVLAAAAAQGGQQGFGWYSGSGNPWSDPGRFADDVGSSLASTISSASTAPGSSSGSGGGGSSGGGSGGGGGGGW
ncbi:DUF2207 domain-containing protein [Sphingomonas sp. SM33]|uniref:DUF2207 domain-containing protein n=1 Tax=Sphingomonas telluris TaxID=2907998 RepID=A0ABS9VLI2_9SPHN|nr:DUF2207 domain-containing protein [Sphingomonas telluris]